MAELLQKSYGWWICDVCTQPHLLEEKQATLWVQGEQHTCIRCDVLRDASRWMCGSCMHEHPYTTLRCWCADTRPKPRTYVRNWFQYAYSTGDARQMLAAAISVGNRNLAEIAEHVSGGNQVWLDVHRPSSTGVGALHLAINRRCRWAFDKALVVGCDPLKESYDGQTAFSLLSGSAELSDWYSAAEKVVGARNSRVIATLLAMAVASRPTKAHPMQAPCALAVASSHPRFDIRILRGILPFVAYASDTRLRLKRKVSYIELDGLNKVADPNKVAEPNKVSPAIAAGPVNDSTTSSM